MRIMSTSGAVIMIMMCYLIFGRARARGDPNAQYTYMYKLKKATYTSIYYSGPGSHDQLAAAGLDYKLKLKVTLSRSSAGPI